MREPDPDVRWLRRVDGSQGVVLLGAFDPPTSAHLAVARGAARALGLPAVLGLTTVALDRPGDRLLSDGDRKTLLDEIAGREGWGFVEVRGGTYLEVSRRLRASGFDATFVIGSDKLAQLAEPGFYPNGAAGVAETFGEVRLAVVPRPGHPVDRIDVIALRPDEIFADPGVASVSATEVRRRVRAGAPVRGLVPPVVAEVVERYTSTKSRSRPLDGYMDEPSLSDHEQRILAEIERNLAQEDPEFVRSVTSVRRTRNGGRLIRLGVLGIIVGLGLLLANTISLAFGVVGFLLMLASAVAIGSGVREVASSGRSPSSMLRDAWRRAEERMRSRRRES